MKNPALRALATLFVLAAGAPPAWGGDAESDTSSIEGTEAPREKKSKPAKEAKEARDAIEFKGRIFALAQQQNDRIDAGGGPTDTKDLSLTIPDARLGVKVRIREGIQLVLEADFSGKPSIKDGFVQAKGKHWQVRAGRFKMPLSAFTLESPWTLPRAHRGQLEDLLADHLLLFGRREGLMGKVQGGGFWDPTLAVGVFQSLLWGPNKGDRMAMSSARDLTSVVRLSVQPGDTEVALVGQRRVTYIGESRAFSSVGLEGTSELTGERYALRLWGEAYLGKSWYRAEKPFDDINSPLASDPVKFGEARVMAAGRRGGIERGDRYFEIFFSGGILDPDLSVTQDHFSEISGGVNVGDWKKTRITLEIEHGRTARNFPVSYFQDFGLPIVLRHTAAMLQVGAAF